MCGTARLREFVVGFTAVVEATQDESRLIAEGRKLLARLVAQDDWLPAPYAEADPTWYRQYLLHCDPYERFSVVSFVWGPGHGTPVHDHRVWGLIGVLRGAEIEQGFRRQIDGSLKAGAKNRLEAGQVASVSPSLGDIHRVSNAFGDKNSISIHVYGGNIGTQPRATFDIETGQEHSFISGYSNDAVPNLWGLQARL
jgi:predicted metal-dependent enzyme (double-stranded beta helix superfamily)